MLYYRDHIAIGQDHETFLSQDLSDSLLRVRPGLSQVAEYAYIVDVTSVIGIYQCTHNTFEAGKEPFRKCVERVADHFSHDFPLTCGHMKPEEV